MLSYIRTILFAFLFLFCISAGSEPTNWVPIGYSDTKIWSWDPENVYKDGTDYAFNLRVDFKMPIIVYKGIVVARSESVVFISCEAKKGKMFSDKYYDVANNLLVEGVYSKPNGPLLEIEPNSATAVLFQKLCGFTSITGSV